ncbi:TnsD family Tn7-like transposition protein [Lysinibacillus sp. NPDC056185]|uniref:TnsD family Tn7-like transposition protein n=1 Tax=Lysinibacillus sp. NPDC056185 TaxID=3345739 RepID=UPI0039EEDDE8
MIGHFPKPYKDELYYSILARYHNHSMNISKSQTLLELTGKYRAINLELPLGLDYFVSVVKPFSNMYSKDYFIDNHTVIPFVKPFKKEKWFNRPINRSLKSSHLFDMSERRKEDVTSKEYIYYCSNCLKEQFEMYGEGYWNRIHQIPGVYVCTKHCNALNQLSNQHHLRDLEFIIPERKDIKCSEKIYCDDVMEALINLAKDVEYVTRMNYGSLSNEFLFQKYKTLLEIKGIAYPARQRQKKLINQMLDFYPEKFLELLNSSFHKDEKSTWLNCLNDHNKSIVRLHPIRHLLLMRFLCDSARNFFEEEYVYEPFGRGPWICMNPLAPHYLQNVIEKVNIDFNNFQRVITGEMICGCGFGYRLKEPEKSPLELKHFNNRIIQKGHVWDRKINDFLNEKLTIKEIALRTKMNRDTITRIIKNSTIKNNEIKRAEKIRQRNEKTNEYRKIWLEIRLIYPNYSRSKLKQVNKKVYEWLWKLDKDWFNQNSPPSIMGANSKIKKYSFEEDSFFLHKAKNLILKWPEYEDMKMGLVRKSRHKLLTLLGLKENNYEKTYPLTADYIETNQESISEFQKRRVNNILEVKYKYKRVTVAQVAAAAHIQKQEKEVSEFIGYIVEQHNNSLP